MFKPTSILIAFSLLISHPLVILADASINPVDQENGTSLTPDPKETDQPNSCASTGIEEEEESEIKISREEAELFKELLKEKILQQMATPKHITPVEKKTQTKEKTDDSKVMFAPCEPDIDPTLAEQVITQAPLQIKQTITALKNPYLLGIDTPKQILLVGPPGTGKSTLAQAIALKTNRKIAFVHAPSLVNEYVHSGAANLRRLFEPLMAQADEDPSASFMVVIDEMTALTDQFKNEKGDSMENATALWLLLDECKKRDNIFFVGITNDPKKMPAQLKSRFLGNVIEVPLPTITMKKKIFTFLLSRNGTTFDTVEHDSFLNSLIRKTSDYSIREIEALIALAKRFSIDDVLRNNGVVTLKPDVLERARALIQFQKTSILDFGAEQKTLTEKLHDESMAFNKKTHKISLGLSIVGTALSIAGLGFSVYQYYHPNKLWQA